MDPLVTLTGIAAPLLRDNIDTDVIIPSRQIRKIGKSGLADGLFAGWRYVGTSGRVPRAEFVLNRARYRGCSMLITGENFGCGSSREHAVWALREFGIRVVLAPSFAPIFRTNCVRNGLLPARLSAADIWTLAAKLEELEQPLVTVDLTQCRVCAAGAAPLTFAIDDGSREILLAGLDPLSAALRNRAAVSDFVARDRGERPWVYLE
jgi:3-isopropylmalate/(R)-2-methylmalate dehydratase small subunit